MDASNLFLIGLGVAAALACFIMAYYQLDKLNNGKRVGVLVMVLGFVFILFSFGCLVLSLDNQDTTNERNFEREIQECVELGGFPELDGYELDECVGV